MLDVEVSTFKNKQELIALFLFVEENNFISSVQDSNYLSCFSYSNLIRK
jgi:hypothetical protein